MTTTYIATLVVETLAPALAEGASGLEIGQKIVFHREWSDYADPHAVSVWTGGTPHAEKIGALAGKAAEIIADLIEDGCGPVGEVLNIEAAGGKDTPAIYRLNIGLTVRGVSGNIP